MQDPLGWNHQILPAIGGSGVDCQVECYPLAPHRQERYPVGFYKRSQYPLPRDWYQPDQAGHSLPLPWY